MAVFGAGLLAHDIWKEVVVPKQSKFGKTTFGIGCMLAIAAFSFWLFHPVPLQLRASSTVERYGPGSVVFGIPWSPDYAESHFWLRNPGTIDYENFDVEISTDLMIEELRLTDGLASCSIAPVGERIRPTVQKMVGAMPVGPGSAVGGVPVGPADSSGTAYTIVAVGKNGEVTYSGNTAAKYRIRCDKFPANSESAFVAAVSVKNPIVGGKIPPVINAAPRPAAWCTVKGSFATLGRPRSITISQCSMGQTCTN